MADVPIAIVDRDRYDMVLVNACIHPPAGQGPHYFFSISQSALEQRPWRDGIVYLLPADSFELQPPVKVGVGEVRTAQAASATPVRPAAKLVVRPEDFPFLHQIRGHDNDILQARFAADPDGFPWLERLEA